MTTGNLQPRLIEEPQFDSDKQFNNNIDLNKFSKLFGTQGKDLDAETIKEISVCNFKYRILEGNERDRALLYIFKRLDVGMYSTASFGHQSRAGDKDRWDKGWGENRDNFIASGFDLKALIPKYIRPNQVVRLFNELILPEDPNFEQNYFRIFTRWLFRTYLVNFKNIYEFGSGSGINIPNLVEIIPNAKIFGMDWAQPSVDIVNHLREAYKWPTQGFRFDFFKPDENLKIQPNSALITIGALEQTGQNYNEFLNYILKSKPELVINTEPMVEWYDENTMLDYYAIKFHNLRGYWSGFLEKLKSLESEGKVEILKMHRSNFGSTFMDGYSQVIWRPL